MKTKSNIWKFLIVGAIMIFIIYFSIYTYSWFKCPKEIAINYTCEELEKILSLELYNVEKVYWKDCDGNLEPFKKGTPFYWDRLEKEYVERCL